MSNIKEIPSHIEFSDKLLLSPSLHEAGIPKPLAQLVTISFRAAYGSWIEAGDPLYTMDLAYEDIDPTQSMAGKIPWWKRIFTKQKSSIVSKNESVTVHAPVSGLCIRYRCCGTRREESAAIPGMRGLIDDSVSLPVLLLPTDVQEWDSHILNNEIQQLADIICRNWKNTIHNLGSCGGYKLASMGQVFDPAIEFKIERTGYSSDSGEQSSELKYNIGTVGSDWDVTEKDIQDAKDWLLSCNQDAEWISTNFSDYCNLKHHIGGPEIYYSLYEYIEELRGRDPKLNQKLSHLPKKS